MALLHPGPTGYRCSIPYEYTSFVTFEMQVVDRASSTLCTQGFDKFISAHIHKRAPRASGTFWSTWAEQTLCRCNGVVVSGSVFDCTGLWWEAWSPGAQIGGRRI